MSLWLLLLVLIGLPVVAAAAFRVTPLRVSERLVSSKAGRIFLVFYLLAGIVECGLATYLAVLAPDIIASYPKEYWRWIGNVTLFTLVSGVVFGTGARAVQRLFAQRQSS